MNGENVWLKSCRTVSGDRRAKTLSRRNDVPHLAKGHDSRIIVETQRRTSKTVIPLAQSAVIRGAHGARWREKSLSRSISPIFQALGKRAPQLSAQCQSSSSSESPGRWSKPSKVDRATLQRCVSCASRSQAWQSGIVPQSLNMTQSARGRASLLQKPLGMNGFSQVPPALVPK